jgi:XTP/dITP diphosphohydrolase
MVIYLATKNFNKVREILHILNTYQEENPDFYIELKEYDGDLPEDLEIYDSYQDNAVKKAQYVYHQVLAPVIAEDSGIEFLELNNFPGPFSKRIFPSLTQYEKNKAFVNMFKDLDIIYRKCRYVCYAVLLINFSSYYIFEGKVEGYVSSEVKGNNGFGYDPIFVLPALNKTFGEIDIKLKSKYSHRAIAFRKMFDFIKSKPHIIK